jgi:hypothetical protein
LHARIGAALSLYAFAGLGLFLLVAPWTPAWTQATYALLPPSIGLWVLSGWVRGIASGLGALDLVIAVQLAVELWRRFQEPPGQKKGGA